MTELRRKTFQFHCMDSLGLKPAPAPNTSLSIPLYGFSSRRRGHRAETRLSIPLYGFLSGCFSTMFVVILLSIPLYGFRGVQRAEPWAQLCSRLSIPLYGFLLVKGIKRNLQSTKLSIPLYGFPRAAGWTSYWMPRAFQFHCMDSLYKA